MMCEAKRDNGNNILMQRKIIVVEGMDDKNLICALMTEMRLTGIQIYDLGGKGAWVDKIMAVKNAPGFGEMVESLGVVRDSDEDSNSAFVSICGALRKAGLSVPEKPLTLAEGKPRVIVMLWPCFTDKGSLEDMCLKSVAEYAEMFCVDKYFECIAGLGKEMPRNMSKAKVKAFLASRPETCPHLGVAALKGYWPFKSFVFDQLRLFLNSL